MVPENGAGFGYNTTGSPSWNDLLCGFEGAQRYDCFGAEDDWKRVVSIIEDITEQQESRARIEASERRYRELFDQAPVGGFQREAQRFKQS